MPLFSDTDRYFRSLFHFLSSEYKRIGTKKKFDFVSLMLTNQIPDDKAQAMDIAPLSGQFLGRYVAYDMQQNIHNKKQRKDSQVMKF